MKKSFLFLASLAILALFLVSCQEGAVAGEVVKGKYVVKTVYVR